MALNEEQANRLDGLFERGLQNEVPGLELVGPEKIREIEPNCQVKNVSMIMLGKELTH